MRLFQWSLLVMSLAIFGCESEMGGPAVPDQTNATAMPVEDTAETTETVIEETTVEKAPETVQAPKQESTAKAAATATEEASKKASEKE